MALEGTLEDFSLADIFQLIGIQRKNGILTLKNRDETVTVKFYNGMVIGADSMPKKLEDRIGKVLVKTGLITPEQLKEALEKQQQTLQKIGYILVDQKYLSREELREALQIQIAQMIYRLFRWHNGEYYFDQKAKVDPDSDDSIAPMSAESILMEGIQMIDEWPIIEKKIPNFNMVFRPAIPVEDLDLNGSSEDEFDALFDDTKQESEASEKIRLSKEEAEVFRLLNGTNSVADVIESSKQGEFHTCKALFDLLERKIIEPIASVPHAVTRTAPQPEFAAVTETAEKSLNLNMAYPVFAVIVAVLLFLNFGDPLKILAWGFFNPANAREMRTGANVGRLELIDSAILMHYYAFGQLPSDLQELSQKGLLRDEDILDAWGKPFHYTIKGESYIVNGPNPDGSFNQDFQIRRSVSPPQPQDPANP